MRSKKPTDPELEMGDLSVLHVPAEMVRIFQPTFLAVAETSIPAASMLGLTRSMCRHFLSKLSSTGPSASSATHSWQYMQG